MNGNKIVNLLKKTAAEFKQDIRCYSVRLAILRLICTFLAAARQKKLALYFQKKKDQYVLNYLEKKFGNVFEKYNKPSNSNRAAKNVEKRNLPVWICWLDGAETAPPLVQQCIKSIEKHAGNHPVIFITWKNYSDYVDFPDYILQKAKKGKIRPAHFSDILRVTLLAQYGGLWLDATIYCNKHIPEEYFNTEFFTCKSQEEEIACISKNRWTTFCLGGKDNGVLFRCLRDFFFEYWKNEDQAIDYLFFDDAIELARRYIPEVEELIDRVPINNCKRDCLISRFADPWKTGCVDDLLKSKTVLFKLGYREKIYLMETTVSGEPTVYSAFLHDFYLGDI